MPVSSETPQLEDNASPALFPGQSELVEVFGVEDEEFPSHLPARYDWMLQRFSRRGYGLGAVFIGVMVTLLIALSALIVYSSANVPAPVLVSPVSSLH